MSLFRPTTKVTDPDGREWEIYVMRYATPKWEPRDYLSLSDHPIGLVAAVGLLIEIPLFLYHDILVPIGRFVVLTPYRYLRGRRETKVWIEAIAWGVSPPRESIRWTTTTDHASRVLDQIVHGLAAGDVAEPLGGLLEGRSHG
jgi:hypothetical protein